MTTINKNLLRAIQNNSLTSVDTQKEPGLVNDCHDTSQKRTSFDSELSEVKNVTKSLSNMVRVGTMSSSKGGISQDLHHVNVLVSGSPHMIGEERQRIETQRRVDGIVNVFLPNIDTTFQVARTLYDNAKMSDKPGLVDAERIYTIADVQKRDLQDEAISLFYQENRLSSYNLNSRLEKQVTLDGYPLFSLIFSLSYSFDDVERLLDRTFAKESFLQFVTNDSNRQKICELYGILGGNTKNSLDNEIMQTLQKAKYFL